MPKEGDYHDKLRSVDWVRDRVAKREALEYKIRKCYKRVYDKRNVTISSYRKSVK